MKKKGILFSLLSMLCLGLVAGCGEDTYKISAVPENYEYGYVTGGGEFTMGSSVNLKIYTNTGCKFDRLVLTKNNKRIEEYTNLTYMENSYYSHSFAVNEKTIGSYKAIYSCYDREPSGQASASKIKVTYNVDLNIDGSYTDSSDPLLDEIFEEEVSHGTKLIEKTYINGKKVKWYTGVGSTKKEYNFDNPVTSKLFLVGEVQTQTKEDIVKEALTNFANVEKVLLASEDSSVFIDGANDEENLNFVYSEWENGDEKYKAIVTDGTTGLSGKYFFEYTNYLRTSGKMKLDKSQYTLDYMKNVYLSDSFLPIKSINISGLTTSSVVELSGKYVVACGDGFAGKTVSLQIGEGKIKSFVYNNIEYSVTYDNISMTSGSSTVPDMYAIRFIANDETLNDKLNSDYWDISKSLKVFPSRGETIKSKFENSNIYKDLKSYGYELYTVNTNTTTCTETKFEGMNDVISSNMTLCIKVSGDVSKITDAYNELSGLSYTIGTTVNTEIGNAEASWTAVGSNEADDVTKGTKPTNMKNVVWNSLEAIKSLNDPSKYYRVEYDSTGDEWNVYLNKTSSLPELKVKIYNGKLTTVKYSVISGGVAITYTNEFTY